MLERYEPNFDESSFIKSFMEARGLRTKKEALAILRKEIKKEPYYQDKIKKALKAKYPKAYVVKISQSMYSQAGIPDIMMIYCGHYFGFEVKRPVVGVPSKLQEERQNEGTHNRTDEIPGRLLDMAAPGNKVLWIHPSARSR